MSPDPKVITREQARFLMSQLADGELSAPDAEKLNDFLELHPDDIDWMENLDITRAAVADNTPFIDTESAVRAIQAATAEEESDPADEAEADSNIIRFPGLFGRYITLAAAIAIVGIVSWFGLYTGPNQGNAFAEISSVVEFVETEVPDASTFVYTDEESGWTVVWVESIDPLPEDHG